MIMFGRKRAKQTNTNKPLHHTTHISSTHTHAKTYTMPTHKVIPFNPKHPQEGDAARTPAAARAWNSKSVWHLQLVAHNDTWNS